MVHLPELVEKYGHIAEFLFVYTDETGMTRATHSHELPDALRQFAEPPEAPPGSRLRLETRARAGKKHFGLRMPLLIDNEQREVQMKYGAGPKRLLIVDPTGRIALDSGTVPSKDFPWQEIIDWLADYSGSISSRSEPEA